MKYPVLFTLLFLSISSFGQTTQSLDQLLVDKESLKNKVTVLYKKQELIKERIDSINQLIADKIHKEGIKIEVRTYKSVEATENPGYGKTVYTVNDGDSITIFGVKSVYFEARFNNSKGYLFLPNTDFPGRDVINNVKYRKDLNNNSKQKSSYSRSYYNYKSNYSTAVRCSGYTQKGTRCKNTTKNSSGRCYLH